MTEARLKTFLGIGMILAHAFILIYVVLGFFSTPRRLLFDEMTTAAGIIAPMFAGHTTLILAWILRNKNVLVDTTDRINALAVFGSLFFPVLFVGALFACAFAQFHGVGFQSFEQFKTAIGLVEVSFGVYVGRLITTWFGEAAENIVKPGVSAAFEIPATWSLEACVRHICGKFAAHVRLEGFTPAELSAPVGVPYSGQANAVEVALRQLHDVLPATVRHFDVTKDRGTGEYVVRAK